MSFRLFPRFVALGLCLALLGLPVYAGSTKPRANYEQAAKFSFKALSPVSYSTQVIPGWVGTTDTFWYAYRTSKGTRFWLVDPVKKTREPLFDHEKAASQLAELSRKPVEANALPFTRGQISPDGKTFTFVVTGMLYSLDRPTGKLTSKGKPPAGPRLPGRVASGDGERKGRRRNCCRRWRTGPRGRRPRARGRG
jgi:hypothetical protein